MAVLGKFSLQIRIKDGELLGRLKEIKSQLPMVIHDSTIESLEVIKARVIDNLSGKVLNVRTNRLRGSFRIDFTRHSLSTHVVYATIHELGGTIVPKRAEYLTFKIGSSWIKTKSVRIPKRPYFLPAIRNSLKDIEAIFGRNIANLLQRP